MAKRQRTDSVVERAVERRSDKKVANKEKAQIKKTEYAVPVMPDEIRKGDRIATKVDEVNGRVIKSVEIKDVAECTGKWRTHVHLGMGCYDIRIPVMLVV